VRQPFPRRTLRRAATRSTTVAPAATTTGRRGFLGRVLDEVEVEDVVVVEAHVGMLATLVRDARSSRPTGSSRPLVPRVYGTDRP
jgi:hypothetical protein